MIMFKALDVVLEVKAVVIQQLHYWYIIAFMECYKDNIFTKCHLEDIHDKKTESFLFLFTDFLAPLLQKVKKKLQDFM